MNIILQHIFFLIKNQVNESNLRIPSIISTASMPSTYGRCNELPPNISSRQTQRASKQAGCKHAKERHRESSSSAANICRASKPLEINAIIVYIN